ncbi:MAG TPA: hypothetical protein VNN08_25455 [Thermoanaerobaculia bacterium]|nr:hypothetical protein [Thermoanaerobaculia bacterium]
MPNETIGACFGRLNPSTFVQAVVKQQTDVALKQQQTGVASEVAGLPNVSGAGTPALIDFLSVFAGSVSDATFNQSDSQYTFEWNIPVAIFSDDDKIKLQSVFNRKPQLDQTLQTKLDASGTGGTSLANSLSDLDDVTISATYAPVGRSIGRTIFPHRELVQVFVARLFTTQSRKDKHAYQNFLRPHLEEAPFAGAKDLDDINFQDVPVDLRAALMESVRESALSLAANQAKLKAGFSDFGIDRLYHFVSNQPQFYATVIDHQRKNLVGPDEVSAKLTYEWGSANLNRFLRSAGPACADEGTETCANKFTEYVQSHAAAAEISDRFSIAAEYAHVSSNDIVLAAPNPAVNLHADGSHQFTGTLAYGRVLRHTDDHHDTRLDVSGSYENFSNDPKKHDRGVVSVIVTTKISDTMSLPFGLAYANHGTFLTDVDKKLNVHFGLIYRMKSNP